MVTKLDNMPDIYFEEEYGKLSVLLEEEGSVVIPYKYKDENGEIYNLIIKRPINIEVDGERYFDLITPYGYGGPIILNINKEIENAKDKLLDNFEKDFEEFCLENKIVTEFVRFHPILNNALDFKRMYEPEFSQHSLITKFDGGRPLEVEFSKSARKNIRKSLEAGISFEFFENPKDLTIFKKIYFETMDRNDAKDFYYFSSEYFDYILENLNEFLLVVNIKNPEDKVIASGLYFKYNGFLHTHLSGTKNEYLNYSPAYILRYALSEYGYENGYKAIHHGGGTSPDLDNSLFLFKKRFTKQEPLDYYISKKVFNKEIYDKLIEITGTKNSKFFPEYRDPYFLKKLS